MGKTEGSEGFLILGAMMTPCIMGSYPGKAVDTHTLSNCSSPRLTSCQGLPVMHTSPPYWSPLNWTLVVSVCPGGGGCGDRDQNRDTQSRICLQIYPIQMGPLGGPQTLPERLPEKMREIDEKTDAQRCYALGLAWGSISRLCVLHRRGPNKMPLLENGKRER